METSLTPATLQDHYGQLYLGIKEGNLEKCLECHLLISSNLRSSGALLLAGRHSLMAQRIGQVLKLINEGSSENRLPKGKSNEIDQGGGREQGLILRNDWLESLGLKLILFLRDGVRSQSEILQSLFGGYSMDITSEKVLTKVVDNINRHIARIIDVSPLGYCLKLA